jgi:hypothetical protein
MDKITYVEKAFEKHLRKIKKAQSIKELIDICLTNQGLPIYSMSFFNRKFKGNFQKAKAYVIKEAYDGLSNAIESMIEEI